MTSWSHLCQHPVQWKSSKIVWLRPCLSEVETSPGRFHHLSRSLLWCYIILMAKKMIFKFTFLQPVSVTFCPSTVLQEESGLHPLYTFPLDSFIKPLFHLLFSSLNKPCSQLPLVHPVLQPQQPSKSSGELLWCVSIFLVLQRPKLDVMWPNDIFYVLVSFIFIARYVHMTMSIVENCTLIHIQISILKHVFYDTYLKKMSQFSTMLSIENVLTKKEIWKF